MHYVPLLSIKHGVCLPMNVDLPTLTISGAVAVGANGFSRLWGTYSEFVEEVELVTGTGEIRTVHKERDGDLWRAVACSLGLFGIFTRITLALQSAFNVRVVNRKLDMRQTMDKCAEAFETESIPSCGEKMIEPAKFALFIGVSWALIISPGPDMIYVITRGMAHGRKAGMLSAIGVVCGILVHTTAAALGLTLILQTSAFAFLLVKFIGAVYLLYLGIKAWRDKITFRLQSSSSVAKPSVLFWQGVLSNVLNPKIAIFFLAFLPQFVEKGSSQITLQMVILGLTFASFGLCFLLVVGYSSGTIGKWLTYRPEYAQFFQRVTAGILMGLGIRLALTER